MSAVLARWRLALRMARRDIRRSKGRSVLVAVMVGTPVMLAVVLSTLYATDDVTPLEDMPATLGQSAARLSWAGAPIEQSPDGRAGGTGPGGQLATEPSPDRIRQLLPGSDVVELHSTWAPLVTRSGVEVLEVDTTHPVTDGMVAVVDGRLPRRVGEVVVTPKLLDQLGAAVGERVELGGQQVTVVGTGTFGTVAPYPNSAGVVALPGTLVLPDDPEQASVSSEYLVDRVAPVTWEDVRRLNAEGFWVTSRYVLENPPSVGLYETGQWGEQDAAQQAVFVVITTAIVLQVVLLAGPAFAVGVRRQRRDLALVAAAGGSPADVRRTVLAQAAFLGAGASLAGAVLGLVVTPLVMAAITRWGDEGFGPYDVMWPAVFAALLLGTAASVLAALVPARQVARQEVTAALVGRSPEPSRRAGWPLVGLALIVVGLGVCFTRGTRTGGEVAVAGGTVAVVLGTVFLTPLVIGLLGRAGRRLPLPLRLAVRDTARQRSRSTPAIAAVMATVAGITALAIAGASDFEQSRRSYTFMYPMGTTVLSQYDGAVDRAVESAEEASGVSFTGIGSAGDHGDENGTGWIDVAVESPSMTDWSGYTQVAVATPAELGAWGVELTPQQVSALDAGGVLVGDSVALDEGRVTLTVYDVQEDGTGEGRSVALDGTLADLGMGAVPQGPEPTVALAVVSPETAAAQRIPYERATAIAGDELSPRQLHDTKAALRDLPGDQDVSTERGFQETFTVVLVLLLGAGGLAVLIGTLTATGLALADARADLATLAAVGAGPRTRRTVAAAQAVVLGTLGALMGVAVGFAPGLAATWPMTVDRWGSGVETTGPVVDIPWGVLAAIVFVVPLIAAAASALVVRSRLPLTRRLAQ
ncbi:FtsX-like permease family protein [Mumia qirimensis]|uniref:FtsX-like permease family protein n=1 Tax=Mumia qirimensis TaxID=3234852 RepID=UPI00351D315E